MIMSVWLLCSLVVVFPPECTEVVEDKFKFQKTDKRVTRWGSASQMAPTVERHVLISSARCPGISLLFICAHRDLDNVASDAACFSAGRWSPAGRVPQSLSVSPPTWWAAECGFPPLGSDPVDTPSAHSHLQVKTPKCYRWDWVGGCLS